jgi:hypothetical protein
MWAVWGDYGEPLEVIASGPCTGDAIAFADA